DRDHAVGRHRDRRRAVGGGLLDFQYGAARIVADHVNARLRRSVRADHLDAAWDRPGGARGAARAGVIAGVDDGDAPATRHREGDAHHPKEHAVTLSRDDDVAIRRAGDRGETDAQRRSWARTAPVAVRAAAIDSGEPSAT